MIRVCHIISGDLWAGAEVLAYSLISTLAKNSDISVIAIVLNKGTLHDRLQNAGIQTYCLLETKNSFLGLVKHIRKIIKTEKIQIIHSHRYKENLLTFGASLFSKKIILISTQHGLPEQFFSWKSKLLHTLNFYCMSRFFYKTISVSNDISTWFLKRRGFSEKKISIIHNGISLPENTFESPARNTIILGTAGRFMPVKNYPLFIEIARLCKSHSHLIFKIAGDGPLSDELHALAKKHGIENNFVFLGHVNDLSSFYKEIDIFVNTSLHEGIPMSILEAMSYGKPVVGSRTGGIVEIIKDGENGYLIEKTNAEAFATKCLLLANDTDLRHNLGICAKATIQESFSINACAQSHKILYEKALSLS